MAKKKKANRGDTTKTKEGLVVGLFPDQYKVVDPRLNKPVCHQQIEKGKISGSMLLQDIDTASINKNKKITYFCPNNIALLLSVNAKSLEKAKTLNSDFFQNPSIELELGKNEDKSKLSLNERSSRVCDYIEHIQTAIVFGYTALETFANLSIPDNYTYSSKNNAKGTMEIYDKKAIERWLSLNIKFQYILRDIYKTKKPASQRWWGLFSKLEKYRNDIIHQKTINSTKLYKEYFKTTVFSICESPVSIIKFFYKAHAENNRTNPIWPWLVNEKNYFPLNTEYDSSRFEVVGNRHEGFL